MEHFGAKNFFESKNQAIPTSFHWDQRKPVWNQVHGTRSAQVKEFGEKCGDADALWTTVAGQPIGVRTADCVPILLEFYSALNTPPHAPVYTTKLVGAIHAGWRGTIAHVVEHFFNSIPNELLKDGQWKASIGPSIRACCYEVSPELIDQFTAEFREIPAQIIEPKKRHLDLIAVNQFELKRLGVSQIEIHSDCTFCSERYFSYRRGDRNARQFSLISF